MYNLEEERLTEEIKKYKAKRILIQLPEGLKKEAPDLSKLVEEKTGVEVFVSADPCYGACDVALEEAISLKADLIIHYGHTPFLPQTSPPIIYLHAPLRKNIATIVEQAIPTLSKWKKIGLITTTQHVHELENAKKVLETAGKTVLIGEKKGLAQIDGQILGCDYSTAKTIMNQVDGFLFIGGGDFHPLGVAIETGKKVIVADPYRDEVRDINELTRRIFRQRWIAIDKARKATRFGIIVGLKLGQRKIQSAIKAKEKLRKAGKETVLLAVREMRPENLLNFQDIDAFVITACPRLATDDSSGFTKPILNEKELAIMLGEEKWEDYIKE